MPYYSVPGYVNTTTTTLKTAITVTASASPTRRCKIFEMILGANDAPCSTDTSVVCDLSRLTLTGTGVAVSGWTPTPSDVVDGAANTTANVAYTTEPQTIVANSTLYRIGMNQRATVRWIAAQESQYLISAATSGTGMLLRALSQSFASSFGGQISFME